MRNFIYNIPTEVHFGKGSIDFLPEAVKKYGTRALLVYGGGSVKRSGLYDKIVSLLKDAGIMFEELPGVAPNPRMSTVRKGVAVCREKAVDVVIGLGGGSSMDCAKAVSAGTKYDGDPWDLCLDRTRIHDALPVIAVPTMAATGSEMDPFGVITNEDTLDKKGLGSPLLIPKAAFCDPTYTFSVPAFQTASGTADIVSHVLETYFRDPDGAFMAARSAEAVLKTCFHYGPIAVKEPDNYDARANLMWCSEWAINGFLKCGLDGAWVVHPIEHQLSAYYDIPHGAGLAVLTPHWFRRILKDERSHPIFRTYAVGAWDLSPDTDDITLAGQAIAKTVEFFTALGLPSTLRELGITEKDRFGEIVDKAVRDGAGNTYFPLSADDIKEILEAAF